MFTTNTRRNPMYERETAAMSQGALAGKADRDASPVESMLERIGEDLEKAQHVLSALETRIDPCLSANHPAAPDGKPGLEVAAGSKLEERLGRIRNQAQGLTERMVRVIDRVRL